MKKSILILFVYLLAQSSIQAQVNVQDSLALVDLFDSTNGSNWTNNTYWLTQKPVSEWFGITVYSNRVQSLTLSLNNLTGKIPSSIENLVELKTLNLSFNTLYGSIPSSIGNLINLENLNLQLNGLNGQIPASIGNLINLETLNLQLNILSGEIPVSIGNLINLKNLNFAENYNMTGQIPSSINNLINLKELYLDDDQLNGNIPPLNNLINLTTLDLGYNQLSGEIPSSIGNLTNLKAIALNNNKLNGQIPSSISNLTNLESLILSNNQLSGEISSSISSLANLGALGLDYNQLSGQIPASIGNLTKLKSLTLNNNQLSFEIPTSIGNLINLESLFLNNNKLSGPIPSSINGTNMLKLFYLYLGGNHFNFTDLESFVPTINLNEIPFFFYSPQANIPVTLKKNILYVSPGGTPTNNTLSWYKIGESKPVAVNTGDTSFTPTTSGKYYVTVTNAIATQVTLYSDTVTVSSVLSASLLNFLVKLEQESIGYIQWQTATEVNTSYFNIERSINGSNFTTIGRVKATGNSTTIQNYSYTDANIIKLNSSTIYYRLQIVDKDGKTSLSKILPLQINLKQTDMFLWPNPVKDILNLRVTDFTGEAIISIYNLESKKLITQKLSISNGNIAINTSLLISGSYLIEINENRKILKQKFIKE